MREFDSSKEEIESNKKLPGKMKTVKGEFNEILERIVDGFLSFDSEWRFTYLNSETAKTLGCAAEELIGKNLWEEFPEIAETEFGKTYLRVMKEKIPLSYEGYYLPFDAWFNARAYPSESALSIFLLNITEQKKIEEVSQKIENRLSFLADALPVLISYVDDEERYQFVNEGYTE